MDPKSETSEDNRKELKDSFERFGDHLSELIVSYLTIEDKFRFQCLSKQWQRIVFNRQSILNIFWNDLNFGRKLINIFRQDFPEKYNTIEICLQKMKNLS